MNEITHRFLDIYKYLIEKEEVKNASDFAKKISISTSMMNEIIKERSNVGLTAIQNTVNTFDYLSLDWLIKGKGHMKSDTQSVTITELNSPKKYERRYQKQTVPLYALEATAGLVSLFQDATSYEPIDVLSIPGLGRCDGAIYVKGDSMYPLLKSGDIIAYKIVNDKFKNIYPGEMYIIYLDNEDDSFTTVKFIQNSERGDDFVKLVSQNQHHAPKDVLKCDIKALAIIKGLVRINVF